MRTALIILIMLLSHNVFAQIPPNSTTKSFDDLLQISLLPVRGYLRSLTLFNGSYAYRKNLNEGSMKVFNPADGRIPLLFRVDVRRTEEQNQNGRLITETVVFKTPTAEAELIFTRAGKEITPTANDDLLSGDFPTSDGCDNFQVHSANLGISAEYARKKNSGLGFIRERVGEINDVLFFNIEEYWDSKSSRVIYDVQYHGRSVASRLEVFFPDNDPDGPRFLFLPDAIKERTRAGFLDYFNQLMTQTIVQYSTSLFQSASVRSGFPIP